MNTQEGTLVNRGLSVRMFRCGLYRATSNKSEVGCSGKRASIKTHRYSVWSRWDKVWIHTWCVLMQACVSLCIIIGVSYWSLHQNHAETTADYRNTDGVDGLSKRNGNMFSFAVLRKENIQMCILPCYRLWTCLSFAWCLFWGLVRNALWDI